MRRSLVQTKASRWREALVRNTREIGHGVAQHAIDRLALFACQALIEHGKPATHRMDRRLRRAGGDDADKTDFHSRLAGRKQKLLHSLAGPQPGENDVDIPPRLKSGKPDHLLGEIDDFHRLAHVEDVDGNIRAVRTKRMTRRGHDQIAGLANGYEIP